MAQTQQRSKSGRLRIPVVVGAAGFLVALTGGIVQTAGAHEATSDGTVKVAETMPPGTDPSTALPPDPSMSTDPGAGPFTTADPCATDPGLPTVDPTMDPTMDPSMDPGMPGGLGTTPGDGTMPTTDPSGTGAPVIIPPGMDGSTPIATPADGMVPTPGDDTMPTGGAAGVMPTPADTASVQPGTNPWIPGSDVTVLPGINSTPMPGDGTSATPMPGDSTSATPMPGDGTSATPVPGSTPSCASVPVPIPTDSVVPIPTVG